MKYNFCFAADDNYIKYACVLMTSIMHNITKQEHDEFIFHILNSDIQPHTAKSLDDFKNRLNLEYGPAVKISINILSIDEEIFHEFPGYGTNKAGQYAPYYRLAIEDFFKNKGIDKLLYLDVDLLADGDLSEFAKFIGSIRTDLHQQPCYGCCLR